MLKALKIFKSNQGIALLITISVTTILVAAALEYNRRARFAIISTAAMRDHLTMSNMATSGVYAAMALLVKDRSESNFDSLQEDWRILKKSMKSCKRFRLKKGNYPSLLPMNWAKSRSMRWCRFRTAGGSIKPRSCCGTVI